MKPAVLRPLAEQDLIGIVRWYVQEGGIRLGTRAFDAARQVLETVERMPGLGSPSIGEACNLPGLRHWGVTRFPIRWFYFERDDQLDVVRLLDERQDIAAILDATPPTRRAVVLPATAPRPPCRPSVTTNPTPAPS